jgi:toxin-antitoxin system PIN domain toxin
VVDTNVLVYAADRSSAEHARCRSLLEGWRARVEPWYLTWSIVYEFLRVSTHPRVFRRPWAPAEAWRFAEALLASPALDLLVEGERHPAILAELMAEVPQLAGNLLHDAHTAALMREHGVRAIYTRDTDYHRFPGIEVRDPLRG